MTLGKETGGVSGKGISGVDWNDWKWQFRNRIRSMRQLASIQQRPVASLAPCGPVLRTYPIAITPYYMSLLDPADENDPLRRQCFPDPRELTFSMGGVPDPLAEERDMPVPGLIHRYPDRCLAIVTGTCAVYCRHCNRKRMWRADNPGRTRERLQAMVDHVVRTPALREVIVSGGDPLLISEPLLDWFLGALRAIPHVEVLRIGSRAPVALPMRITPELCAMLKRHRPLWFNTQFNHAREITEESARACEMLLEAGIPVGNLLSVSMRSGPGNGPFPGGDMDRHGDHGATLAEHLRALPAPLRSGLPRRPGKDPPPAFLPPARNGTGR
ncbi:MAG: KamA family radical SAM protein [Deltaproteobacteria bacterium]|nr:KamA family radical SAM protein [Deltaproteobacteria bacterium]